MSNFFYLAANSSQGALDLIEEAEDAIILFEPDNGGSLKHEARFRSLERAGRAISIDSGAVKTFRRQPLESSIDQRERIVRAVLADFKVFLLRMRFLRIDHEGVFSGLGYFSDVVDYALTLSEKHQPEKVFCGTTPHTVESWLVVRTLEEYGARVVRLIASPLPWVLLPIQGLTNTAGCSLTGGQNPRPKRSTVVDHYLSLLRGDYLAATPYYEKKPVRSIPRRLLSALCQWGPRELMRYAEKLIIKREFKRAASRRVGHGPYAVYFLHYQPEANTLPEADLYVDQFQAVKKLSDAMPSGMSLLIKEHPSILSKRSDRRWRPVGFYERLLSLPNTCICPPDLNTFEVIDRAVFVASIAGVCLTEAMARGKVAVTFYTPRFALFRNGLVVDANLCSVTELRALFSQVSEGQWTVNEGQLRESFEVVMSSGYDGALDDTCIPQSGSQSARNSERATCLAIRDVLDGVL